MSTTSEVSTWGRQDRTGRTAPSESKPAQRLASLQNDAVIRLQNAADFVIRTVLETIPEPGSGSAWLKTDLGLSEAAFVGESRASRSALKAYLAAILSEGPLTLGDAENGVRVLGPVSGYFSAAMLLPIFGPDAAEGYLLFTSDVLDAFDQPQRGLARRMAAHLRQYWTR